MKKKVLNEGMNTQKIEEGVRLILEGVGENVNREGLLNTPARVARMYQEVFAGLNQSPEEQLNTRFEEHFEEIIILREIPFVSMCEHHLLPFKGNASVGYIPGEQIVGLSKLARVVEVFARRPQVQERLTTQIAETIFQTLSAKAVGVVIESEHSCMTIRGIKKPGAKMITSSLLGEFRDNIESRKEFFRLVR